MIPAAVLCGIFVASQALHLYIIGRLLAAGASVHVNGAFYINKASLVNIYRC